MSQKQESSAILRARISRLALTAAFVISLAGAQDLTCPAATAAPGNDFHGQTIAGGNFSYRDLTNANFSNTTLIAPYFAYANLTGANFQGAIFINQSSDLTKVSDFSFANLQRACFLGARFDGLAYFTSATLTCADFSKTDLSNQNAIFGPETLNFDRNRPDCRLAFRSTVMDCEFVSEWRFLDLSRADIKACSTQLAGADFSGAKLNGVNLEGANLDGTKFVRADLSQAILNQTSLQGADLSYATLLGAHLNRANLTNATLYHAFLSNDTQSGISNAAQVRRSHLKNVNLSYAQLSGVDFTYSNIYGDNPAAASICKTALSRNQCSQSGSANYEGFTCGCASAHGALLTKTSFAQAYLYGLDLTAAQAQGLNMQGAVLTGGNLNGAAIATDPLSGAASTFFRAFLQGTALEGAQINNQPTFEDAFVDFSPFGNTVYIFLDAANHNEFKCNGCSPPTGTNVCVVVNYPTPTRVPNGGPQLTCPNRFLGDCGPATPNGSNTNWKSGITNLAAPPNGVPSAWYETNSTYIPAAADLNSVCNGQGPGSAIFFW